MEGNFSKGKNSDKTPRRIGRKVGNLVAAMLGVSITTVVILCVLMFYRLTMSMMENVCVSGTNVLAYELANYSGPDDQTALLDALKEQMGCEFTIFRGNERAYTTIQQNGQRAVGTRLSDELSKVVLEQGKAYVGKASILGEEHLCSYVPTRGADGEVDGLIFAGISMSDVATQINLTVILSFVAGVVLIFAGIMVVGAYIKQVVTRPLFRLTVLAETLEQGNLGLSMSQDIMADIHSDDEIGILAQSFDKTISRLKNYIGEISSTLESVASGDLTLQISQEYVGDFAVIRTSLNNILQNLNRTMSQIVSSSECVSGGASQMSSASQGLSQGAVEQTGAVEGLEQTMEEVVGRIRKTADNAGHAQKQAGDMGQHLADSNQKMQEMMAAMEKINDSSKEIGKIIKAIEDIAFQTNILALNASVEAARAGAAGKGFAVVSEEVRDLAGKTAEASKSTAALIERSITAVQEGTRIAGATAKQLEGAVAEAQRIVGTINNIAADARTQADAMGQIEGQISQISSVTQTNSATAQESSATSEELSAQAGLLRELVKTFRLRAR
ncbi:MAG: HAMP domain-containing protein [Lachnospiraceae bacterium]|jgi:methyl-accepting chemotaxis protein|nr:HAMP domain-containing protein [Lachnospiraceae bacterium]